MPVGDAEAALFRNPIAIFLAKTFGTLGLHDHLRIAPLTRYANSHLKGRKVRVLEVGCGEGLSLFELQKALGSGMTARGYDFDPSDIAIAQRITLARRLNIEFRCEDATLLADLGERFDVILLMDFLEHISDPKAMIAKLAPCLSPGGEMIVSVPTPRYPLVFTRKMHERIGHLVDGYTEETLRALFPPEFELLECSRNTGYPAQLGCWIQARLYGLPYRASQISGILLSTVFRKLDWFNGAHSCSLFAVFRKSR